MSKAKPRPALGTNPLSQGIFSKTIPVEASEGEDFNNQDSSKQELANQDLLNQESIFNNLDSTELAATDSAPPQPHSTQDKALSQAVEKSRKKSQEKRIKKKETSFLSEESIERVNLRLSIEINDWLDSLLKQGKRRHGRKIPKETWVQAALELFRAMPVDWQTIDSEEALRQALSDIESRIKNEE